MVPDSLARQSFLHKIITSGETTSRYLFHEVENVASIAKLISTFENNYSR